MALGDSIRIFFVLITAYGHMKKVESMNVI